MPDVTVAATRYTVSAVPENVDDGGAFEVQVEYWGGDGGGR